MRAHNWMATHWKPASAFAYTLICFFDFVVFPSYVGINRIDLTELISQIRGMDADLQSQIIRSATIGYEPFTLRGSGLFHLAFGALLTGAAIRNGADTSGLVYTKRGAEYRRRREDEEKFDEEESDLDVPKPPPSADVHGYQPKKGSDPGPPPKSD